jgi:hypothetical protein
MVKSMVSGLIKSGLLADVPGEPSAAPVEDPWQTTFPKSMAYYPGWEDLALFRDIPQEDLGIQDMEDGGVFRCIDCLHEIEDGACSSCGRLYPGHAAFNDGALLDGDLRDLFRSDDEEDDEGGFDILEGIRVFQEFLHAPPHAHGTWSDDDVDDMGSFIQDDDEMSDTDSVHDHRVHGGVIDLSTDSDSGSSLRVLSRRRIVNVASDDSDIEVEGGPEDEQDEADEHSDDDGGDEEETDLNFHPKRRPRRRLTLSSDDEEEPASLTEAGDETADEY